MENMKIVPTHIYWLNKDEYLAVNPMKSKCSEINLK